MENSQSEESTKQSRVLAALCLDNARLWQPSAYLCLGTPRQCQAFQTTGNIWQRLTTIDDH